MEGGKVVWKRHRSNSITKKVKAFSKKKKKKKAKTNKWGEKKVMKPTLIPKIALQPKVK
jgi:hypothetical protein